MLEITDIAVAGYQEVKRAIDPRRGLHALVAVHSTALGPALGGMRMWPYASEQEALFDVLRLSKGMTYKAACAGLDLGGGKSVVIADPRHKSEPLFEAMGEFIDTFAGRYITAEDVNTKPEDMDVVARKTCHVAGRQGRSGNPSPKTAYGCFLGLRATLEAVFGSPDLHGKVVAVEGCGSVGSIYAEMIAQMGGKIVCADVRDEAARRCASRTGGSIVPPERIRGLECDVYAPCALGGSLNDETIPRLSCRAVVGAANNQLLEERHGEMLHKRGILYAPDYVVNAGGLINVYNEVVADGYSEHRALAMILKIYDNLREIYAISRDGGVSAAVAANRFAEKRISSAQVAA